MRHLIPSLANVFKKLRTGLDYYAFIWYTELLENLVQVDTPGNPVGLVIVPGVGINGVYR
jgi:hypothetical protein